MYPSSSINICNFIYNSPIPSPPLQYDDDHFLLQHIHTLLLQEQQEEESDNNFHIATTADRESNGRLLLLDDINNNNLPSAINEVHDDTTTMNSEEKKKKCSSSKKDRHSKIHTAHGPRDRRMRLSLDVARKFFDLQDMLGFDKASKTVDWLLTKSRSAIKDLKQQSSNNAKTNFNNNNNSSAAASECEAVSGVLDQEFGPPIGKSSIISAAAAADKKAAKAGRVRAAFNPLAKESRNKARERARERTKMKNMLVGGGGEAQQQQQQQQRCVHEMVNINDTSDEVVPPEKHNSWSLSDFFHCHQNPTAASHQQHQFADHFQYSEKFWESYNNGNL